MRAIDEPHLTKRFGDAAVGEVAASQHGVFTKGDAVEAGLTRGQIRRRIEAGHWERLAPGVYRAAGSVPTWKQSLIAATMMWGSGSRISHRAAAALVPLSGFPTGTIELTVPGARQRANAPGIVHRGRLHAADLAVIDGIPVTSHARTLVDLAAVCDRDRVEEALDEALVRRLVSVRQMRWQLEQMPGQRGVAIVRALVDARDGAAVPESTLETRVLRVILQAKLPPPARQMRVGYARIDFIWPDARLVLEASGYRWHAAPERFTRDNERRNRLVRGDWRVIIVTWDMLEEAPHEIAAMIREMLPT